MTPRRRILEGCLGYFEAYRRLGFAPEEIFFCLYPAGVAMGLRAQGKSIDLLVGKLEGNDAIGITLAWNTLAAQWNSSMTKEERERIYWASWPANNAGQFVTILVHAGFTVKASAPSSDQK